MPAGLHCYAPCFSSIAPSPSKTLWSDLVALALANTGLIASVEFRFLPVAERDTQLDGSSFPAVIRGRIAWKFAGEGLFASFHLADLPQGL